MNRPQGAEERPPARQDLGGTRLHQLTDGCHHLQGPQRLNRTKCFHIPLHCDTRGFHKHHQPLCPRSPAHLVLDVVVAQLQLHDVFEGPEERLVEAEVRRLGPAGQNLGQNVVDEGDGLLGDVALLVARRLQDGGRECQRPGGEV